MSFLTASSSRTWLPILGIIEEDPYRSRNTVAHARSSHRPRLYRESQYVRGIGEGAVFQVSLYEHKGVQFAVKKAKATPQSEKHGLRAQAATGTLVALQEIQVVSSAVLRRHPNIIDIFGWDWDHDGLPVLFTNYAELGTLQDFLRSQTQCSLTMAQRRSFALNVACGLHALHATNVAHGDIKLANTLVYPDPRMPKSFIVKVSDFSHSVFGLSSRRITSYPGSALYNAPEVRSRYALIPSDRLPRCESYSFGLLAWEILKNGTSYFEETWSNRLSTLVAGKTSEYSHVDLLHEFRPDEILELSVQYLHSFYQMQASCYDFHIFNRVFQMTLKDNPSLRKDMGQIAATLDYCDEADIVSSGGMSFSAIHGLNVWDFNPWDSEPWASKVEFVREIQQTLQESRQPMHAEMMLLLARCYAEGYGVTPDIGAALKHAHNALVLGSTEATCMIYALNAMYTGTPSNTTFASVTPELQESVAKSLATVTKIWNSAFKSVTHHDVEEHRLLSGELVEIKAIGLRHVLRSWNRHAAAAILDAEFRVQIGDVPPRFKWTARSIAEMEVLMKEYGKPLCDIIITHPTQLGPNMTSTFLETCASIGWFSGLSAEHISVEDTTDFSDTCYGDQVDFLLRLLIAATKSGQTAVLAHLIHVIKTLKSEQSYLQGVVFGTGTGESPLHHIYNLEVTEEEVTDLVLQLLDLGIDIDGPVTTRSWVPPYGIEMYGTPLQVAVRAKCLKSVKALVNAGADITASHNELPPALSIAISMHCPLITRYLLPLMDGQAAAENAVRALGTPPKKGWFEDVLTETLTFENVVTVTENLTLEDVVNETLTFTFTCGEGSSMVHTAAEIFYHLHGCPFKDLPDWWYQELDGLPLMEAIERGQRNIKVMATLIQLGLGPRSFEGRWKILQAILNKSKDDPFRPQLLALLFSRRMIDSMGWLSKFLWEDNLLHAYQHTTELVEGWPEFFRQFRGECHDWSLLHILAQDSDYQAVNHVLSFFPHGDTTHQCLSHVDDFGLTPVHVAHSRTDKDVYRLMMRQFPPKYKGPIKMLRSISEAQLSYEYQENMFIKFMDKYGYTWKHIRRTQGVELRFRGPVWEETQLIAKAEAEKNLAPGSLGTGLIGLDGTGYEGLEKFWHNGRITHETKIMRAIAKETVPKAKIAELFFDYACWTLQNEYFSLAKAEDLCVMGNLYKMEATGLGSGHTLLELPLRKWTVPEPFCRIYTMQSIMGKSPEEMVRRAYQRLLRVPPDYIPNLRQQEEQMGPEALREYYSRERRVDYVTEGGGGSRLLSIRPDVWQRMRL